MRLCVGGWGGGLDETVKNIPLTTLREFSEKVCKSLCWQCVCVGVSRLAVMEGYLGDAQREKTSIEECLSILQSQHSVTQEEKSSLCETVDELQSQLRETQATLETSEFVMCKLK